jgi:hypothetical protein
VVLEMQHRRRQRVAAPARKLRHQRDCKPRKKLGSVAVGALRLQVYVPEARIRSASGMLLNSIRLAKRRTQPRQDRVNGGGEEKREQRDRRGNNFCCCRMQTYGSDRRLVYDSMRRRRVFSS